MFSASLNISNLTAASGQVYVVPSSGLQTGGTVYRDRAYTFKTVPSVVQGAAYIRTANDDKAATNSNFLSFTVNEPVSVYVAYDDRIKSKPSWLGSFTDTGANLVTSDAPFSLFVRAFPAGTITLGGNASGGCCSMYSVIVKSGSGGATTTPTTTTPTTTTPTTTTPTTSTSSSSHSISNLTVASGQVYVVPASGIQAGGTVYRDRAYTFKSVPAVVQGAAYIKTANDDKAATNSNFLSFTVNEPVSVYVAHGDRIKSKPSWLGSFTDTGANLVTSDATFSLFVRAFPAGTITLGGNASGGCCSMYSVIVKSGSGGTTTTPTTTTPTTTTPTTTTTTSPTSSSSSSSDGDTYFVAASNGNDGNSGTQQSPFKTLERGVDVLQPGDTLYVRGGTYKGFYFSINIPSGNSWSQPVIIKAYQQEKVVLTSPANKTALQFVNGAHHIIVDGFTIDARGGAAGIGTGNAHHIRIMNGEVMNASKTGVIAHDASNAFEFINLRIHDNGSSDYDHGLYITTSNHLVKDCEIYRNTGWGVHIYGSGSPSNNRIMNNKVYNNARSGRGAGIGVYRGTGNSIVNNIVWGQNKTGIDINSGASNTMVYNNTIHKEAYGIYTSGSSGTKIINNIVNASSFYGVVIKSTSSSTQLKNNLVYGSGSGRDILNQASSTTLSKNLEGNNFDPKFQNVGSFDFRLRSGSPAIDAGINLSEVKEDFAYTSRPRGSGHDIGAFEGS
ncbi:MAG: hypothetical protein NPIRA03_22710 [Nitrospirales bacterium]|nr:MAG: hypothetical protein NPIRA03_22710 [Nitrospirales bacterium]